MNACNKHFKKRYVLGLALLLTLFMGTFIAHAQSPVKLITRDNDEPASAGNGSNVVNVAEDYNEIDDHPDDTTVGDTWGGPGTTKPLNICGDAVTFENSAITDNGTIVVDNGLGVDSTGDTAGHFLDADESFTWKADKDLTFHGVEMRGGGNSMDTLGLGREFSISSPAWANLSGVNPTNGVSYNTNGTFTIQKEGNDTTWAWHNNDDEITLEDLVGPGGPDLNFSTADGITFTAAANTSWQGVGFYGFYFGCPTVVTETINTNGTYTTTITAGDCFKGWDRFFVNENVPEGTSIEYTIYDAETNLIIGPLDVNGFEDISSIPYSNSTLGVLNSNLILQVNFTLTETNSAPILKSWNASYYSCTKPEIKFKVVVENPAPAGQTNVENTVQITTTSPETNTTNNVSSDTINILLTDLEITKVVDLSSALTNDTLVYTLSYTNKGPNDGTNVYIRDILPDGVSRVSHSSSPDLGNPVEEGRTNTWFLTHLGVSATGTITVTVKIDNDVALEGSTLINVGNISNDRQDKNSENDEDKASTFVGSLPNLVVTKNGPTSIKLGETNSFTITIENTGNTNAYDVSASDVFPSGLIFVGASPVTNDSPALSWTNLGDLASGASTSITVQFTVTNLSSVFKTHTNSASATPTNGETSVTDNSDEHPVYVDIEPARLSGTVRIDPDGVSSNDADRGGSSIAGVTITLTGTDVFGNSVTQTTVTAADGTYSFSGLNPGTYTVTETQPEEYGNVSSFVGTNCVPCAADAGTNGANQITNITLAAGDASPNNDFSEFPLSSLGNRVWLDLNIHGDGEQGAESGLDGVTVFLYCEGCTEPMRTNVTSGGGFYLFENLEQGNYFVEFVLPSTNYSFSPADTFSNDELDSDVTTINGVTGRTDVVSLGINEHRRDVDAGVNDPPPNVAVIKAVDSWLSGDALWVEWETVSEHRSVAYFLKRRIGAGYFARVSEVPKYSTGNALGDVYSMKDPLGYSGGTNEYVIEELELDGLRRFYGPFHLVPGVLAHDNAVAQGVTREVELRRLSRMRKEVSDTEAARIAARGSELEAERELRDWLMGDWLCLEVEEEGIHFVSRDELGWKLNMPDWYVEQLLKAGELALRGDRGRVSYWTDAEGSGLYFYGEAYRDVYATKNSYHLGWGLNQSLRPEDAGRAGMDVGGSFRDEVSAVEDKILTLDSFLEPEADFWMLTNMYSVELASYTNYDVEVIGLSTPGVDEEGSDALLSVNVKGGVDISGISGEHELEVLLNGVSLGRLFVNGTATQTLSYSVSPGQLLTENEISFVLRPAHGAYYSMLWINECRMAYDRHFVALNDHIILNSGDRAVVTVEGFSTDEVMGWNISDPANPRPLLNLGISGGSGNYQLSFHPSQRHSSYLFCTAEGIHIQSNLEARIETELLHPAGGADYLVIAAPELMYQAQRLADYRNTQGYSARVVDIRDVYSAFSNHRVSPYALKQFLGYALTHWEQPPSYILLVGDGSIDYRNLKGYADMLVPSLLEVTPYGLFVSDTTLADFDDVQGNGIPDGIPDVPIGRLPAQTSAELSNIVSKIISYESNPSDSMTQRALFVSDVPDASGNYPVDSQMLINLLPAETETVHLQLEEGQEMRDRALLREHINTGYGLVNYLGHGSVLYIGNALLETGNLGALTNRQYTPVLLAMTCSIGRFSEAGSTSLAEELLLKEDGGAIAIWASSGLSQNYYAKYLNEQFLRIKYLEGETILGKAMLETQKRYHAKHPEDTYKLLQIYNLIGDPALRMH